MRKVPSFVFIILLIASLCFKPLNESKDSLDIVSDNKKFVSPKIKYVDQPLNPFDSAQAFSSNTGFKTGWKLLWRDEFNRAEINYNYWTLQEGKDSWGNNELQHYTDRRENCYTENGKLIIKAIKENYENSQYSSARIMTKQKVNFYYGKIEIRAKLPKGKGLFPAFWLLPTEDIYGDSKKNGEIDIMEMLGDDPKVIYGVAHYSLKDKYKSWKKYNDKKTDFSKDFHVYSLEWSPRQLNWLIDSKTYFSFDLENTFNDGYNPYTNKFYLIMNLAVGGDWPGTPTDDAVFPASIEVDYVRYYAPVN
jgi:beta-glucanase (GH16 family)